MPSTERALNEQIFWGRVRQARSVASIAVDLLEVWEQLPLDVRTDPGLEVLSKCFDRLSTSFDADYGV